MDYIALVNPRCCMDELEYNDFITRLRYYVNGDENYSYENFVGIYWAENDEI